MCGRYQFTEPQNADLRRILQDVRRRCGDRAQDFRFGDVMPTAAAPVLIANGGKVVADLQTWGIPGWKGGLMINARAETVCEKPMFRRSMAAQRCVIPATSFYEWDAARHKYQFALPGEPLYLAGLYDNVDGANRFVILTTTPNASMHGIHDRMPLVLPARAPPGRPMVARTDWCTPSTICTTPVVAWVARRAAARRSLARSCCQVRRGAGRGLRGWRGMMLLKR